MSSIEKHSVVLDGHKTSVSLERAFWQALGEIAADRRVSLNTLIADIDRSRAGNLSSALRLFVLAYYRERAALSSSTPRPTIPAAPS
jgi:predicted DNA-binding ribbon-helix-helix protein